MDSHVVLASYRGPALRSAGDGSVRGGGGLIQLVEPWARDKGAGWVFALHPGEPADSDQGDDRLRIVPLNEEVRHLHYDVISNSVLWPLFHRLPDLVEVGAGARAAAAWSGYRQASRAFAEAVADLAPEGARVVVHDYQLLLVPGIVATLRPDLQVAYFHHIPFASAEEFELLPPSWRGEIAASLSSCVCGFQSSRWLAQYEDFCAAEGVRGAEPFVAPVHPDVNRLQEALEADEVGRLRHDIRQRLGGRRLVARVDRADPMKNVLTGVDAFDLLLASRPELRGEVVFAHHLMPTRGSVPAYRRCMDEIRLRVAEVNDRWGRDGWDPIDLNLADHREYGLALFAEYDVLLVNPVREGLNLVSHEGPALNQGNGAVVLSREAGAYDTLGPFVLGVDPTSAPETATALERALLMSPEERAARAGELTSLVRSLSAGSWHDRMVEAAFLSASGCSGG